MTTGTIISIVLGIAGIMATIIFTMLQMKKRKIDHYFINSYDVGKGLTDVFPEFQLHYGNEVLSKNVKVLQGGFMNTGRNDIGDNGKKTSFKLILPSGCIVKNAKVSPKDNGLKVNCPIKNEDSWIIEQKREENELSFEIDGIMKSKEWFNYIAIVETPNGMGDLYKQLRLDHRIKDTTIKHIYLGPNYNNRMSSSKAMVFISVFGFPLFLSAIVFYFLHPEAVLRIVNSSPNGVGIFIFLVLFLAFFIFSSFFMAVLFENLGRRGRVVKWLMKKQNGSDYGLFESFFI